MTGLNSVNPPHTLDGMNSRHFREFFVASIPLLSMTGLAACSGSGSTDGEGSREPATTAAPTTTTVDPNLLCGTSSATGTTEEMTWGSKSFGTVAVTAFVNADGTVCGATAEWDVPLGLSEQINEDAIPVLNKAVQSAKSADIQAVSGATATSQAYVKSLQAALDK